METKILFIVFGVIVQFCDVLGRHNFYEYYYTRHHKGHSTSTETVFPTTLDNLDSSEHEQESSSLDYISWQKANDMISTPDENSQLNKNEVTDNIPLQNNIDEPIGRWDDGRWGDDTTGKRHSFHHPFMSRTLLIVGSIIIFLLIVGMTVYCCPKCCRGTEYTAHNRRVGVEIAAEVLPQQPMLIPYPVQQAAVLPLPVHYPQAAPEYQPRTLHTQPQWSQGQHLPAQYPEEHFPPEYQPQMILTQPHCSLGQSLGQQFPQQQHPREHYLPEYQPQIVQQLPTCPSGQHSYNLPEAPPPYESHIKY